MQIPILSGITADESAGFRTQYPRNLVPVPKQTGIAQGYLKPAEGIELFATGPGVDRGGFDWEGVHYRVMGTKLCTVSSAGDVAELGDVGAGGRVRFSNGFGYLSIWSGTRLYYWDGSTLTQVTDPDLGSVIHGVWIAGYNLSTDGQYLIVTELADKTQVNPLKYGNAETDPDPLKAVDELRNEAYAFGRYSIEVFDNFGGDGFPFQRIEGAMVPRGIIGTHAYCEFASTFAFLGSGRNEAPAVYLMAPGDSAKISTAEIDKVLERHTESELSGAVLESRVVRGHAWLYVHLPDTTLVYDLNASKAVQEPVWFELNSAIVGRSTYRARNMVLSYGQWISGDPTGVTLGTFTEDSGEHYGDVVGWDFGTIILYNEGRGAIVNELELVALTGHVSASADPVILTSYSVDGETWSAEKPIPAGKQGQRNKRLAWRKQGRMTHWRIQRFRGTSDCHVSFARLEAQVEPLSV